MSEKSPAMKVFKKRKMKVDKSRKMNSTTKVDPLVSIISKNEEMEERIPLGEVYRRMKTDNILGWGERRKGISAVIKEFCDDSDGSSLKLSKSDEESDPEEDVNIRRSPVEIKGFSYYFDTKVYGDLPENEPESDEEVFGDSYRVEADFVVKKRVEIDRGFKFVVKKRWKTVTNPKVPETTYFKSDGSGSRSTFPVLHDPDFPLAAISKLALKTYNTIQNTKYEYVGLVKAYKRTVNGFFFWTRFKARLRGQDAINFQAKTFRGMRDRNTNVVPVEVKSVYPLPQS